MDNDYPRASRPDPYAASQSYGNRSQRRSYQQTSAWAGGTSAEEEGEELDYPIPPRSFYPPVKPQPTFPLTPLVISGSVLGIVAALGWQAWQFVAPMIQAPVEPEFQQAVVPPPKPTLIPLSNPLTAPTASPLTTSASPVPAGNRGKVIEPIGLAMRTDPDPSGAYIGGIVAGETVTVLEMSSDRLWQRVRRELTGQEGWVKAGNLGPLEGGSDPVAIAPSGPTSTPAPIATPTPLVVVHAVPQSTVAPTSLPSSVSPELIAMPAGSRGRVVEPIGLALRAAPSGDGQYIGGIPMNELVRILEVSQDGKWQRIQRDNGQEGWIKSGNLQAAVQ